MHCARTIPSPLVASDFLAIAQLRGSGKTSVRDVKNYVKQYLGDGKAVPPQHVIVYDEAQRAWDLGKVVRKHGLPFPKSEPEAFVDFGERIPEWYEPMHDAEEAGLGQ
jgi:hypothetical protein